MSDLLHPMVRKNLSSFLSLEPEAKEKLENLQNLIRKTCSQKASEYPFLLDQMLATLGHTIEKDEPYERLLALCEEIEKRNIHHKLTSLRKLIEKEFNLRFPNTYQCCAFLLLTMFPEKNQEDILKDLSPDPMFFETTESYDYDGDPSFRWEDPLTTRLVIDWCPHSVLTDPDVLMELIWRDHKDSYYPFEETYIHALFTYFADLPFEELPKPLQSSGRYGIREWIHLMTFDNLKSWAQVQVAEYILQLDEDEYELKEAIPHIPESTPRYEEMIRHLLSLNGLFLQHMDPALRNREELVDVAITSNGMALRHAPEHLQHNSQFIEKAIRKTPMVLADLPEAVRQDPQWIKLAIECAPETIEMVNLSIMPPEKQHQLWTQAISTLPALIQFVPKSFRQQHPDLFRLAYEKDHQTVVFAQPEDAVSADQLRSILQEHPLLFALLPEEFRSNSEYLKIVVQQQPKLYRYLPAHLKGLSEFVNIALETNPTTFPEIEAHAIPDAGLIQKVIDINPLLIPPRFITLHYPAAPYLCEQYLGGILNRKNKELLDLEDDETNFQTNLEELKQTLRIPKEMPRRNPLSRGITSLLDNITQTDSTEPDLPF